ncbi:MAG: YkgJ family cysteine cluster protein [Acidimicrobiia bacterium]|nr:YkgJ family cysteine cluster protein [Acidimicrobiia bacterium]
MQRPDTDLAADDFSSWLDAIQAAIGAGTTVEVPCGSCTACCTSSQFVHVGPEESDALAHIPAELLFPAPGLPDGHVVLGYDERGHCPMFVHGGCSIYDHRPRTCRTYDCRVLPAAGFQHDDDVPVEIGRRATQWRFTYETDAGRMRHQAVEAAATFLAEHPEVLPPDAGRPSLTRLAALAVEIYELFLQTDSAGTTTVVVPGAAAVRAALRTAGSRRRAPVGGLAGSPSR